MVTPYAQGSLLKAPKEFVTIEQLVGTNDHLVVIAPHPDDEALGCGGALAAAVDAGLSVTVICLTDGRLSHPNSKNWPQQKLIDLRKQELRCSVDLLTRGQGQVIYLDYPDQQTPQSQRDRQHAVDRLHHVVADITPASLWVTWHGDPHIDHINAAHIAAQFCAKRDIPLVYYSVWGRFVAQPINESVRCFDTSDYRLLKERAVAAHRSQMTGLIDDDLNGFVMDKRMQEHFITQPEYFLITAGA